MLRRHGAAVAVGLAFAVLYLAVSPSLAHQHWDALDYARACETRGLRALWGNHPLGHLIHCGVFRGGEAIGFRGRALPLMVVVSSVAAALALAAFYVVAVRVLRMGSPRALGWTAFLGGSYGVWHYAGTSDIYTMALAIWVVAWGLTLHAFSRPSLARGAWAGAAIAAATLAHQFGGLLLGLGAAVFWLWRPRREIGRALAPMLACAGVGAAVLIGGYVVLGWLALGTVAPEALMTWLVGYGTDPTYGRFLNAEGALQAAAGAFNTLWRWWPPAPPPPTHPVVIGAGAALLFAVGGVAHALVVRRDAVLAASVVQVVVGAVLVTWWEPWWVGKFWLFLLPPLVVALDAALEAITRTRDEARRFGTGVVTAAVLAVAAVTLLHNGRNALLYERRPIEPFEDALARFAQSTTERDLLIENGRLTAHLLFWVGRPGTLNLYRSLQASGTSDPFADLRRQMQETWAAGGDVWYVPGLGSYYTPERLAMVGTTPDAVDAFFDEYAHGEPVFTYREEPGGPPREVFRLRPPPGSSPASARTVCASSSSAADCPSGFSTPRRSPERSS